MKRWTLFAAAALAIALTDGLRDPRREAAGLDLPAQRPQLGRHGPVGARHGRRLGRVQVPGHRRASQAARPVDRGQGACGGWPGDAVPARRTLERRGLLAAHAPHAGTGLLGAGHRLPRLRQEHAGPALGRDGLRGCPRRLGLARRQIPGSAPLHLRPFAGRRRGDRPGRQGRRRAAAPSSKARSPRSPTWPAPWHGAGCRWGP